MLKNKGFTYISLLIIFFLLAGTTWNVFFFINNFKKQGKILDKNVEIFYTCSSLSKESFYLDEDYSEIYQDNILYIVEREKGENLDKTIVSAYQDSILKKKICRYRFSPPEVLDEHL